ncbi:hypothetical protein HFP43_18960 [Streptomyces sp. SJ1-7]|nr:hypothetical protein [Streptomyces sp. SJ1-7]
MKLSEYLYPNDRTSQISEPCVVRGAHGSRDRVDVIALIHVVVIGDLLPLQEAAGGHGPDSREGVPCGTAKGGSRSIRQLGAQPLQRLWIPSIGGRTDGLLEDAHRLLREFGVPTSENGLQ